VLFARGLLQGFSSALGTRVNNILKHLFPVPKDDTCVGWGDDACCACVRAYGAVLLTFVVIRRVLAVRARAASASSRSPTSPTSFRSGITCTTSRAA
jgi:hypothetical protein